MVVLQELQVGWFFKGRVFWGRWHANSFQRTRWKFLFFDKSADPTVHRPIIYSNVFRIYHDDVGVNNARYFHCLLLNSMVPWPYIFNWVDFIVSLTAARVDGWPLPHQKKNRNGTMHDKARWEMHNLHCLDPTQLDNRTTVWRRNDFDNILKEDCNVVLQNGYLKKDWSLLGPRGTWSRKLGEFFRIF